MAAGRPTTLPHRRPAPSPYPTTRYITEGHRDVPDFAKDRNIAAFGSTFGVASGYRVHLAQGIGVVLSNHGGDMGEYEYFELIEYLVGDSRFDFNRNGKTNLGDLFFFADQFGTQKGDDNWDAAYDLDASGKVDFPDFFLVADFYADNPGAQAFDEERHFE